VRGGPAVSVRARNPPRSLARVSLRCPRAISLAARDVRSEAVAKRWGAMGKPQLARDRFSSRTA
jgi:hypothetical protein